jgi:hypothetical protein
MPNLSKEQLELMEKWHSTMVLMDIDVEEAHHDYEYGNDNVFTNILEAHDDHLNRLIRNDTEMRGVLLGYEMGVTATDIYEYFQHLSKVEEENDKKEQAAKLEANPIVVYLKEHEFKFVDGKQYPNHIHFSFKDKTGLEITARLFQLSWRGYRIWLHWKDKSGKKQKMRLDPDRANSNISYQYPASSPAQWTHDGYYKNAFNHPTNLAQVVAYRIIKRSMSREFTYPKA